ncbi:acyl-CoA synthetase [Natronomonas marina]|jgi:acetyl-CoA synthetase|uniref:acyl-CoA synthetase n=1 Tax=Natronomonas marina TaxID=2961939 RepID=UPI0020C96017|nr:AMP-binding protein [Natronomonas marina]
MERLEAYYFHEEEWDDYQDLYDSFEWQVPEEFNAADYVCDRWADADEERTALYFEDDADTAESYTFADIRDEANRLANYLAAQGIERGDRIGVNLPQRPETLMAHIAAWKLGAVSVPLSTRFGPDALEYRLGDSGAKAAVIDASNIGPYRQMKDSLSDLDTTLTVGDVEVADDETDFWEAIEEESADFENATTAAEDDLIIVYTSGTTGAPKGVRHAHRVLLGHLPSYLTAWCNLELNDDDVFFSPAEWAWVLVFDYVFPTMFYGLPQVAYDGGEFDPEAAFELIDRYDVTSYFAPPTALRMMRAAGVETYDAETVRVVPTGGEPVGVDIVEWVDERFEGAVLNEVYGQTEANLLVGSCEALMDVPIGKIGVEFPGHEVRLADQHDPSETVAPGEVGEFAAKYEGDPVCFKEYWNKPDKTEAKIRDGWVLTGDLGVKDEDGYYSFHSRKDDVILTAGYRVGPSEIEESLADHPAVANAGVIGVPDDERGEVPKAFVVLAGDDEPTEELKGELKQYVKDNLAMYEYPRELEFIDELPKTVTDKVRRKDLREREGLDD